MIRVLHMIDRHTPVDALRQLRQLARPSDTIVSVGPDAGYPLPLEVVEWHEPMGSAWACGMWNAPKAQGVDVVHVWSTRAQRTAQVVASAMPHVPLVRTLPGVPPSGKPLRRLVRSLRDDELHVTVPTQAGRRLLIASGVDAPRVHVLPAGAEAIADQDKRRTQTRRELGVEDGVFVLVAPDQLVRPAGHNFAAWAHAIMRYVLDEPSYLIVPVTGPMQRAFETFARGAGFIDLTVIGLPVDRFADALAAADVAVFFRLSDCGGSALTAAMAAGLPIVAFDTPDVLEIAGDAAMYTKAHTPRAAGQALLRVHEEPGVAATLASLSRTRAESFTIGEARTRLDALYEALRRTSVESSAPSPV